MSEDKTKDKAKKELSLRVRHELWNRGELSWKLHVTQQKIDDTLNGLGTYKEALLFISRRLGKSFYGVIKAMETCLQNPGSNVLIIGPNEKQVKRIVTPLIDKIRSDAPEGLVAATKSEGLWKVGKSTIYLAGFDTAIESIRGLEFTRIITEEIGSMVNTDDYTYILQSVLRPTLMHTRGNITHVTTPSKMVGHPLHTITIPKTKLAGTFFKYTIWDNPLLKKEEIEQEIEEMGGIDSEHCQRELFCEIVRTNSLAAVPDFSIIKNVKEVEAPEHAFKWISGDFGGVRDKSVFHMMCYDFLNDKVLCLDELVYPRSTPTSQIVAELRALEKQWGADADLRYIDCPGQIRVDLSKDHDFHLSILKKEKGSFEAGLNHLSVAFRAGRLIIHPKCQFTIVTLETGMLNDQRSDFGRTEELGHCDALASLSYGWRHRCVDNPFPNSDGFDSKPAHLVHRRTPKAVNSHPLTKILFE